MRKKGAYLLAGFLALLAPVPGCEDGGGPSLNPDHEGYGNPGCWAKGCHTENNTHNADLQPYECVECHGTNGAPAGHGGETPCGECHEAVHGNRGFPDPESCLACH